MAWHAPHALRVQRKRTKGFRLPDGTVCVTRPGPWGNPFTVKQAFESGYAHTDAEANEIVVFAFEDWLLKGDLSEFWFGDSINQWMWMRQNLWTLQGKRLACFCPLDRPCHADILASNAGVAIPYRNLKML